MLTILAMPDYGVLHQFAAQYGWTESQVREHTLNSLSGYMNAMIAEREAQEVEYDG